ncbi:MAG: sulfatase [Verrucomicrobiales bacterium]
MRIHHPTASLALAVSICLVFGFRLASAAPNVLFIAVDDLRPELACYGEEHMHTPNIDALARSGRLFRNHYVAVPTCGASRYALLTGRRPTAASDGNDAFNAMPATETASPESWVHLLRQNGWRTVSIGKITHEPDGFRWSFPSNYDDDRFQASHPDMRFSFDEIVWDHDKWGARRYPLFAYADGTGRVRDVTPAFEIGIDQDGASLPDEAYPDGQIARAAVEKLREFADDGSQFCLAVGFHKPHLPFNAPKAYFDLYDPATIPGPDPAARPSGADSSTGSSGEINAYTDTGDRDALRHAYLACVSYTDAQVGKVLAELEALDLADETIVVLWGDHGWCIDDYARIGKHSVLERAVESPLIIRAPSSAHLAAYAGITTQGVVESIDIYPTIAELCGLGDQAPPTAVGSSLVPMLRNPFAPGKEYAFSRWGSITAVRTRSHRLINSGGINDLYDLTGHRYELADIASSQPAIASTLAALLGVQAKRGGTTYAAWAGADPRLASPPADADGDGSSNALEYAVGTDPLAADSAPAPSVAVEDLGRGLEPVFSLTIDTAPDDLVALPSSSSDLDAWFSSSLRFLDARPQAGSRTELRFHLDELTTPLRFFRMELSEE